VSRFLLSRFWSVGLLCDCLFGVRSGALSRNKLTQGRQSGLDLGQANREATPTRERVCLNGLWRWQPTRDAAETVPSTAWGYFKVFPPAGPA